MRTRKQLRAHITQLQASLTAAGGGETRKNLRERVKRLVDEQTQLQKDKAMLAREVEARNVTISDIRDTLEARDKKIHEFQQIANQFLEGLVTEAESNGKFVLLATGV